MPKAKTNPKKAAGKSKKKGSGAKLSKALRGFGPIKDLINSNFGREVLADVLIAAASAAAAVLTKKAASTQKAGAARDSVQTAAGAVANAVTDAARNFLPASLLAEDEKPARTVRIKTVARNATRKPKALDSAAPKKRKASARKAATAVAHAPASEPPTSES